MPDLPIKHREITHHLVYFIAGADQDLFVINVIDHTIDHLNDGFHMFFFQSAGCNGWCAYTQALSLEV